MDACLPEVLTNCFNSIKVRLRLINSTSVVKRHISFNSIKVRLRRPCSNRVLPSPLFQFHKGSIKTGLIVSVDLAEQVSIP